MTVKELKEALSKFPEDKEVVMWCKIGVDTYDYADFIMGYFEVNSLQEITNALDRKLNGKIKVEYIEDKEVDGELKWSEPGKHYIKTKSGLGNFKDFQYISKNNWNKYNKNEKLV